MSFQNIIYFVILVNLFFHEGTSEPLSPTHNTENETSNYAYAFNTPFADESDMESFILGEWQHHPSVNISRMVKPLKEILYAAFNPDKSKIKVCYNQPLSTYKKPPPGSGQPDQVTVTMPSLHLPLEYFIRSLELMLLLNDANDNIHDEMMAAMKNLDGLKDNGHSLVSKFIRNCKAVVIVPRLFKGNVCAIAPIIETYLPVLANVSLIKLDGIFLRYDSVKSFEADYLQKPCNATWDDLKNTPIPKADDDISFENLKIVIDHFQRNLTLLYLRMNQDNEDSLAEKAIPLSHWQHVYNTLHINVYQYLKLMKGPNGSQEYEKLPWIGFEKNTPNEKSTDIVSLPMTNNSLSQENSQPDYFDIVSNFGEIFHQPVHLVTETSEENSTIRENSTIEENSPIGENSTTGENSTIGEQFFRDFPSQDNLQSNDFDSNSLIELFDQYDAKIDENSSPIGDKNDICVGDSEPSIVGINRFKTNFHTPPSFQKNGMNSNNRGQTLEPTETARSNIQNRIASFKWSKSSDRPSHHQIIKSKPRSRNSNVFADHTNGPNSSRNRNAFLASLKKDLTRQEPKSTPSNSDVLVSSAKRTHLHSATDFNDSTLVEKIRSKFYSSHA